MKVATYYNNNDIRIEDRPVPEIGPGEILVKVMASGICGSDVMEWYRVKSAPRVLGHEMTGEIVKAGQGVEKFSVGDRVFVSHHVPCNTCAYCLKGKHTLCSTLHSTNFDPGGFAQFLRVPKINVDRGVFLLPDNMSYEDGTFIEPLACVLRGQKEAGLEPGQSVLVLGSGISGLLHVALARALGAGLVIATDISQSRLRAAKKFGADLAIQASYDIAAKIREANHNRLADVVIVATGAISAFTQALKCAEQGATIHIFAPSDPGKKFVFFINDFWTRQLTINSTYAAAPVDIREAIDLIAYNRVKVNDMITHRLPLEQAKKGFSLVAKAEDSIKVIIFPQADA